MLDPAKQKPVEFVYQEAYETFTFDVSSLGIATSGGGVMTVNAKLTKKQKGELIRTLCPDLAKVLST